MWQHVLESIPKFGTGHKSREKGGVAKSVSLCHVLCGLCSVFLRPFYNVKVRTRVFSWSSTSCRRMCGGRLGVLPSARSGGGFGTSERAARLSSIWKRDETRTFPEKQEW